MKKTLSILGVLLALLASGCSGAVPTSLPSPSVSAVAEPVVESATPTPRCGLSAEEAFRDGLAKAPKIPDTPWGDDFQFADVDGYDPCAPLSVISISIAQAMGIPMSIQMLFSHGEYLYPATPKIYGFPASTLRISPNALQINYLYAKEGESLAEASGIASSTFTMNDAETEVVRTGQLPLSRGDHYLNGSEYSGKPAYVDKGHRPGVPEGAYIGAGGPIPEEAVQIPVSGYDVQAMRDVRIISDNRGDVKCQFYESPPLSGAACGVESYKERNLYPSESEMPFPRWVFSLDGELPTKPYSTTGVEAIMMDDLNRMVLNPGEIAYSGVHVCAASNFAMTCWNSETGHGVYMSNAGYESW